MIERYFVPGFVRRRVTKTETALGGWTEATNDSPLEGCLRPLTGDKRLSADKMTVFATHRFYTYPDADIRDSDVLLYQGRVYRIKGIADPMSMGRHLAVDLELSGHDK